MKKKNKLVKYIFLMFLFSFIIVYFSELTGYYNYQNHKKVALTNSQIEKYEKDIASGKAIDINKYLIVENKNYQSNLSKFMSSMSDAISNIVKSGVEKTFNHISKVID